MPTLSRRHAFLGFTAAGAAFAMRRGFAQAPASGPFTLPPLPYPPDANEPHIDTQTMQIHHERCGEGLPAGRCDEPDRHAGQAG
jgi:Fe-Mn family superoxide dismutase